MTAGRIALVGSGEYLPVMEPVESWLLADRPRVYVQLATAAAPEGERSLARWHSLGADAARRLDAQQVVIDVRTRADATGEAGARWAALIEGAGLIYLSGGNPGFLARTLRGTTVWSAIEAAWRGGASLAGCSAGAMALCGYVPDFRHPRRGGEEGLGLLPEARVLPHFDRYTRWIPDFALRPLLAPGTTVVGVDEDTALVAEGGEPGAAWAFRSRGERSSWLVQEDRTHRINAEVNLFVS